MVYDVKIQIKVTITKKSNTTKNVQNIFTKYVGHWINYNKSIFQCMSVSSSEVDWEDWEDLNKKKWISN